MPFPNSKIFHPLWVRSIPHHFPVIVTVRVRSVTLDSFGAEIETYADGLVLNAHIEPYSGSEEVKRPDQTIVKEAYTIALQGFFPAIALLSKLELANGESYSILGIASDDFERITYLTAERINEA